VEVKIKTNAMGSRGDGGRWERRPIGSKTRRIRKNVPKIGLGRGQTKMKVVVQIWGPRGIHLLGNTPAIRKLN